jgi:hypothetical protein
MTTNNRFRCRLMTLDADHFGLLDDPATATVLEQALAWIGDVSA